MLKIVTDGSVDMPPNWKGEYEIDVIPLYVRFGETSYMPGVNLNTAEFYELVQQNGIVPKTSLPSPDQIAVFYRKIAQKEDEILSVHLGSKLSGTFSTVQVAAKELEHEFKIYPFDSEAGSAALGFMCKEARVLSRAGLPLPGIIQRLEDIRSRVMIILTVDNLEFARLSGRVNAIQSTLSSVLRIKPIIILRNGLLEVEEKARTRQRAIERIIGYVSER
ncbi:MAG: DegV family protein, partial [Anaerolineaceae bacterium]|nr:DegV family protein [Anaerolineaceae bacterium]